MTASRHLFAIMMDSLTENIRKKHRSWQMMFADDVVQCAREKDVVELELEQWREGLEKRGMKVSRARTEYIQCLNGTPLGSVHIYICNLPKPNCHRSPNLNIWEAPCRVMVT